MLYVTFAISVQIVIVVKVRASRPITKTILITRLIYHKIEKLTV